MTKMSILSLCFLASMLGSNYCANILVLEGTASKSHHIWMRTLMVALAARGHNITSISPDVDKEITPNLHYIYLENTYTHLYTGSDEINFVDVGQMSSIGTIKFMGHFSIQSCEGILTSKGVDTLLNYPNNFKFDLVLHDNLLAPCLIGFLHKFKYPPLVHVTAFNSPALSARWVGSPFNPYVKPYFSTGEIDSFLGRVENYCLYFVEYFYKDYYIYPKMNAIIKKVFPEAPKIAELEKHVKLVLFNSHPAIEIVENVHIRSWLPQTEILNHKNTILFITHSGLLSTQESIWYGVPMLCLPVFADQFANSELVKRAQVAEVIPISTLNSTNLKDTMATIFNNSKYRANAVKLSKLFRDQPELPLQRAIWWLEWVLRNPDAEYLNSPVRDLNVFSRHAIDITLFLVVVLSVTLYISLKLVGLISKCIRKNFQRVKIKKN